MPLPVLESRLERRLHYMPVYLPRRLKDAISFSESPKRAGETSGWPHWTPASHPPRVYGSGRRHTARQFHCASRRMATGLRSECLVPLLTCVERDSKRFGATSSNRLAIGDRFWEPHTPIAIRSSCRSKAGWHQLRAAILGGLSVADTGEDREIRRRTKSHEEETAAEAKKLAQAVKGSSAAGMPRTAKSRSQIFPRRRKK